MRNSEHIEEIGLIFQDDYDIDLFDDGTIFSETMRAMHVDAVWQSREIPSEWFVMYHRDEIDSNSFFLQTSWDNGIIVLDGWMWKSKAQLLIYHKPSDHKVYILDLVAIRANASNLLRFGTTMNSDEESGLLVGEEHIKDFILKEVETWSEIK